MSSQPFMIIRTVELTGYAGVRSVFVSLPRVAALIDGTKYMEPGTVKPPEGTELRRQRAPRGPGLRTMVRYAVQCADADELGHRLKWQRQEKARALVANGMSQTEAAAALGVSKQTVSRDLAETFGFTVSGRGRAP